MLKAVTVYQIVSPKNLNDFVLTNVSMFLMESIAIIKRKNVCFCKKLSKFVPRTLVFLSFCLRKI